MTTEVTREQVLAANPLLPYLERAGVKLVGQGNRLLTNQCAKTCHADKHLCVTIDAKQQLWHCNDCDCGGTIID